MWTSEISNSWTNRVMSLQNIDSERFISFHAYFQAVHKKQARQCTYNLTLRRIRETIVAVEKV